MRLSCRAGAAPFFTAAAKKGGSGSTTLETGTLIDHYLLFGLEICTGNFKYIRGESGLWELPTTAEATAVVSSLTTPTLPQD